MTASASSCNLDACGGAGTPTAKSSGEQDAIVEEELVNSAAGHGSVILGGGEKPGIDTADELRVSEVPQSE